jgi:hypothetical protein
MSRPVIPAGIGRAFHPWIAVTIASTPRVVRSQSLTSESSFKFRTSREVSLDADYQQPGAPGLPSMTSIHNLQPMQSPEIVTYDDEAGGW